MKVDKLSIINDEGEVVATLTASSTKSMVPGSRLCFFHDEKPALEIGVMHGNPFFRLGKPNESFQLEFGSGESFEPSFVVRRPDGRILFRINLNSKNELSMLLNSNITINETEMI